MQETQKEKSTFTNVVDKAGMQREMGTERQLEQILTKYVRAADSLNGERMGNLLSPDGNLEVYYSNGGKDELLFVVVGRQAIADAFTSLMKPHPDRGWSHHTTFDPIIEVNGHTATLNAQFIRFDSVGEARPAYRMAAGGIRGPWEQSSPPSPGTIILLLKK